MGMKRRDLLKGMAAAAGAALAGCGSTQSNLNPATGELPAPGGVTRRPNILLMIVDEFRLPPVGYGPTEGEIPQLKELLGFRSNLSASNGLASYYRAFARLRENSVVMRTHYIAAAACAPSRTSFITGTYPAAHGVTQTDGMFKGITEVQFLDPEGIPTLGDWMRAGDTRLIGLVSGIIQIQRRAIAAVETPTTLTSSRGASAMAKALALSRTAGESTAQQAVCIGTPGSRI